MSVEFEIVAPKGRTGLLSLAALERTVDMLRAGEVAILPTETGYMLAALATSEPAILKVFQVKGRNPANVMHVACSSLDMAAQFGVLSSVGRALIGAFTPGPLSVVVPQTEALPNRLVTLDGTVGIRVPDHPGTLQVIAAVGAPLTATSLNAAGQEPIAVEADALARLDWPSSVVVALKDDAAVTHTRPSTLLRITSGLEVLREGPVSLADIQAVLSDSGLLSENSQRT